LDFLFAPHKLRHSGAKPLYFRNRLCYHQQWKPVCRRHEKGGVAMRAIVTVIGKDQIGIIASVCGLLAAMQVNILDISQTLLQEYFTMIMLVDVTACTVSFDELGRRLANMGEEKGLSIRIQREDIFEAMHRV
jgi:ACT domain-containing protein